MKDLTRAEAEARAALLEVDRYEVDLDLRDEDYLSTTVVRFRSAPGSTFLELDAELLEGDLDGRPLEQAGNRLALDGLGGEHVATVRARGAYTRSGEGLHRFVDPSDGAVYLWSMSFLDDAQRLLACFDQPDLKASFVVRVTCDPAWTVVANSAGRQVAPGRWEFDATERIATYLLSVNAGPWHGVTREHGELRLGLWCRRSLAPHLDADAEELFDVTVRCLADQEQRFGRAYPFGPTYDQLFVPEFNPGAMENPGAVTFTEDFLFRSRATTGQRRRRATVVAHEMAHMWFGDLVTMRWWDDLWLNESFAELIGYWSVAEATSFDGGWLDFSTGRKAWGHAADAAPTTHPVAGQAASTRTALLDFDGISYAKGASVLRQLAVVLGPEVFFAGVRRYLAALAWGSSTLDDLVRALEAEAGRDLSGWVRDWLRTTGANLLRTEVEDGQVVLVQEGTPLREHRTSLARFGDRPERVELVVTGARTPTGLAPTRPGELLLPDDADLSFVRTRLDEESLRTAATSLDALPALPRALVTASVWDALRSGDLPADRYLAVLDRALRAEDDPVVLATLAGQVRTALLHSPDPGAGARVAATLDALVGAAEPGSDLQLERVRAWTAVAPDPARVEALLAGALPGLAVDDDLRWALLTRLAVLGAADRARLDAALEQDRTSMGERAHLRACAALPGAADKERAWAAATAQDAGNLVVRATGEGFWHPEHEQVLLPYAQRAVAELPRLWEERSPELARRTVRALFPGTVVRPEVVAAVDGLLAQDLPDGLRRGLLEEVDDLRRAVRSRQTPSASATAAVHWA